MLESNERSRNLHENKENVDKLSSTSSDICVEVTRIYNFSCDYLTCETTFVATSCAEIKRAGFDFISDAAPGFSLTRSQRSPDLRT